MELILGYAVLLAAFALAYTWALIITVGVAEIIFVFWIGLARTERFPSENAT